MVGRVANPFRGSKLMLLLFMAVASVSLFPSAAATIADPARRCLALRTAVTDGVVVDAARLVAAGAAPATSTAPTAGGAAEPLLPSHCLIQGMINRRLGAGGRSYGIGFELRLPVDWNGRFLFQGGAGLDGVVLPAVGRVANSGKPPALARGFAVATTDGGHRGSPLDATFAVDQQARIDYAYNAVGTVTIAAKAIIRRFYARSPLHSYFVGCSNGGRQALTAAERFPLEFDGIVAGDPSIRFSRVAIDEIWNNRILAAAAPKGPDGRPIIGRAFSDADLQLVRSALLRECDRQDGLADGMINDWQRCHFDPVVLACDQQRRDAGCLNAAQIDALHEIYRGPHTRDGRSLYGPFNYDTGIASRAWRQMKLGSSTTASTNSVDATLGLAQFKYLQLTPPDPTLTADSPIDFEAVAERVRHTAMLADADNPFLSTFVVHGRMIVYNGLSDQGMASRELADWYESMLRASGPGAGDAVRLFLIPGMLHCGGGEATDEFEMLDAIVDWVEHGRAPERIEARSRGGRQRRPLCPHPLVARYKEGEPDDSASFECRI